MHKDYIEAVLNEYHNMVISNRVSLNLCPLTPGNVKRECKAVCTERFRKVDERLLSAVFGYAENVKGYLQAIEGCDIDKFRPMINFVEGRSKDTDAKNIELLAWLIDFKDRPFNSTGKYGGLKHHLREGELQIVTDVNHDQASIQPTKTSGEKPIVLSNRSRLRINLLVTALIISLLIGAVGNLSLNNPAKVWYIKLNGEAELYADMSNHPIFTNLKPLPQYIIDDRIQKNIPSNVNGSNGLPTITLLGKGDGLKPLSNKIKTPSSDIYVRCQAITKKKTQCLRNAKSGGLCWQHLKQGS